MTTVLYIAGAVVVVVLSATLASLAAILRAANRQDPA